MNYEKMTRAELVKALHSLHSIESVNADDAQRLLEELQIHQVELEMQNRELREAQQELEESRDRYADLYDFAPVGYLSLNMKGCIEEINLTGAMLLGVPRSRLMGKPFVHYVVPGDVPIFLAHLRQCQQQEEKVTTEISLKAKGDAAFPVQLLSVRKTPWHSHAAPADVAPAQPAQDATPEVNQDTEQQAAPHKIIYKTAMTDITERKRAEAALLERAHLAELNADIGQALTRGDNLEAMLRHCAEVTVAHLNAAFARIWTLDRAGTVLELQASAGMYTHLDGPHGRVPVGQFKIGLIAQERRPHLTNEVIGDPSVSDQQWARREGMVAFAGYPLVVEDSLIGVMAMFSRQPLTAATLQAMASVANSIALGIERKRGEAEREQLILREQVARAQAETANRAKDEFLAMVSHELRTPLSVILGWSNMLRNGELDEAGTARGIEIIERNARAQAQLIQDILDVARINSGKMRLEVKPLGLAPVLQVAIDSMIPAAAAKAIEIEAHLDPEVGLVSGDSDRLGQVILNLLSNAIKFTPEAGRIEVRLERAGSQARITVSDTGQGISADFLPYVFDSFRQSDSASTREYSGLGLGLSIVRSIVEMHGGTVVAASDGEGQGASFTLSLPLLALHRGANFPPGEQTPDEWTPGEPLEQKDGRFDCPPEVKSLRVLIVEDEPRMLEMLSTILEQCGAEVRTSVAAVAALDVMQEWKPDLLISDIAMPGKDGYWLIARVRALEPKHGQRMPAVALTAYVTVGDRARVLAAGFDMFVPKPVEPGELLAVIVSLAGTEVSRGSSG